MNIAFFIDYLTNGIWGAFRVTDNGPHGPTHLSYSPMNRGDLFEMIRWAEGQCGPGEYVDMSEPAEILFGWSVEGKIPQ